MGPPCSLCPYLCLPAAFLPHTSSVLLSCRGEGAHWGCSRGLLVRLHHGQQVCERGVKWVVCSQAPSTSSHLRLAVPGAGWETHPLAPRGPRWTLCHFCSPWGSHPDPGPALPGADPDLTHLHSEPRWGPGSPPPEPQSHLYFHHMNSQHTRASGPC